MDKFVYLDSNTNGKENDLLSLLKNKKNLEKENSVKSTKNNNIKASFGAIKKITSTSSSSTVANKDPVINYSFSNNFNDSWASREGSVVSGLDIVCESKLKQMKAKNYVGWKIDSEGRKAYTTFRNGQRVESTGNEAFKLALADGKIKKRKTEDQEESNKIATDTASKRAKSSNLIQPTGSDKPISSRKEISSFFKT